MFVPRVLDVEKGKLCFIIGTVYMDMPLKPNVLEDIARDVSLQPPTSDTQHDHAIPSVPSLLLPQGRNSTPIMIAL